MNQGTVKLIRDDRLVIAEHYYTIPHRKRIISSWEKLINVSERPMFLHIIPGVLEKQIVHRQTKRMRVLEKWQNDLIEEHLWNMKPDELAKKAKVSHDTIYSRRKFDKNKDKKTPEEIVKEIKFNRPPSTYSNKQWV